MLISRCRAGDGYAGGAVAGDAGAGGHIEDAVSDRQRGRERAAVAVRHRDAGDRQMVSSATVCAAGTVLIGASLTATTVTSEVAGWLSFIPSLTTT